MYSEAVGALIFIITHQVFHLVYSMSAALILLKGFGLVDMSWSIVLSIYIASVVCAFLLSSSVKRVTK